MSDSGGNSITIPDNVKKTIQSIREITGKNHSDEDVYSVLQDCSMDPDDTAQKLLFLGIFLWPCIRLLFLCFISSCINVWWVCLFSLCFLLLWSVLIIIVKGICLVEEKMGKGESFGSCMCYFDYWTSKALNLGLFVFWVFWFCLF